MDTIYEPLVRYRPPAGGAGSGPGHYQPAVLESWTLSPDGREMRLVVGKGQRFHDGRRVTSVDVQYTLDMARSPRGQAGHVRSMLQAITTVELVGPRVVRVRLAKPSGYVLRAFAELPVLSAHVYQGQLRKRGIPVIGSGPYKLAERSDERVVLERWSEYHGDKPAIERVVFVAESDAAVALTAAKQGELDIIPELIEAHFPSQARAPQVVADFEPLRLAPPTLRYAVLNLQREPLDDHRVRRALAHLVDRDTIATKIHRGLALPAPGPVWPGGPADGAAPAAPVYDPKLAADLLDRAGWRADGSGVRRRSGQRLKVDVLVSDDDSPERDLVLKSLRRVGIAAEVRVGSPAVLQIRMRDGDFDLAFISAAHAVDRDLRPWLQTGGKRNWGGYSSPIADRLLGSMAVRQEPAERSQLAGKLAAQLARDWPIVPLVRPNPYGLVSKRVRGLVPWNGWFSIRDLSLVPEDR
jgi:peptide/nickel transport system substrate-binding protein